MASIHSFEALIELTLSCLFLKQLQLRLQRLSTLLSGGQFGQDKLRCLRDRKQSLGSRVVIFCCRFEVAVACFGIVCLRTVQVVTYQLQIHLRQESDIEPISRSQTLHRLVLPPQHIVITKLPKLHLFHALRAILLTIQKHIVILISHPPLFHGLLSLRNRYVISFKGKIRLLDQYAQWLICLFVCLFGILLKTSKKVDLLIYWCIVCYDLLWMCF